MHDNAVGALGEELLDWRFKAIPASAQGMTVDAARKARLPLDDFGTPLLTLDAGALDHNIRAMARWAGEAASCSPRTGRRRWRPPCGGGS
ncbi:hypothetical protein [Actinomadura madurae]|uniref:hypothetical protein n=1 Tax=Actinomadura madurae TaxID=1993 RepID=UPI0020D24BD0|nr:hypothetical protein [Actinomadura madurae]MCP9969237.1 hypothetical protein [Actinomadura madurae]MCP9981712.1 hypothetical protein [Actinomadura madurae]